IVHAAEVIFGPDREMGFTFMTLPCVLGYLQRKFDGDKFRAIDKEIEKIKPDVFEHLLDTLSNNNGIKRAAWVINGVSCVRNPYLVIEVAELILLNIVGIEFDAD